MTESPQISFEPREPVKPAAKPGFILISALVGILSLGMGMLGQMMPFSYLIILVVSLSMWLLYSFFMGFDIKAASYWLLLFLIKPGEVTFYAVLVLLILYILLQFYQGRQSNWYLPYPLAFTVLIASGLMGMSRAAVFADALPYFCSTVLLPVLVMMLWANNSLSFKDMKSWLKLAVLIGAFLGIIGVIMGIMNPEKRLGSLWITAMTINGFYTMCFFFSIGLALEAKLKQHKWFWAACALAIFLGMMYTYTRVALIAVVLGLGILMWRIKRFRLVGIITLAFVPLVIPASMVLRFQAGFEIDESLFIRFVAWYHSIIEISQNPILGIGISTWKSWYHAVVPIPMLYAEHSHNLFLKIWLEFGLFGMLAYFYIIASVVIGYWKRLVRGREANLDFLVLLACLAILFSCLTDIFIQQYSVSVIFWATLAFMYMRSHQMASKEAKCKNLTD